LRELQPRMGKGRIVKLLVVVTVWEDGQIDAEVFGGEMRRSREAAQRMVGARQREMMRSSMWFKLRRNTPTEDEWERYRDADETPGNVEIVEATL
jgi:hypothetical protein